MNSPPRRVATETVTANIDGVNTVVAEAGQVVPLAYDHLVPDDKTTPLEPGTQEPTRSTSTRRTAAAAREDKTADDSSKSRRSTRKSDDDTDK